MEQKKLEVKQIYWKVQTIPQTNQLEVGSKEFNLYKEKYQEYNKLETDLDVLNDYNKSASKNPLWGKIHSLSIGFVDEATNVARIKVLKGAEKDVIQNFLNICNEHFKNSKIIGYNLSFLLPFLRSRMLKNKLKIQGLPSGLIDLNCKPWTLQGICLQDGFKGIGWWSNSLEELAYLLNLETNFIEGEDIYSYFLAEKEEELNQSIIDETFTLINCHKIINGEHPCKDLSPTVVLVESTEEVKQTVFDRIFSAGELTKELEAELFDIIKDFSQEEKEIVIENLRGTIGVRKVNATLIKKILK
jgi:hypothetical protein